MNYKQCTRCGLARPMSDFTKTRLVCRPCLNVRKPSARKSRNERRLRTPYRDSAATIAEYVRTHCIENPDAEKTQKTCSKCGKLRWLDEFGLLRTSKDGHNQTCRWCVRTRSRRYYDQNRERVLDAQRKKHHDTARVFNEARHAASKKP